jgi:hypothetical protein
MPIPQNITREPILKAIQHVDLHGVRRGRNSQINQFVHIEIRYPPNFIISLANKYANGTELEPNEGGSVFFDSDEAVEYLVKKGFQCIRLDKNIDE